MNYIDLMIYPLIWCEEVAISEINIHKIVVSVVLMK